MDFETGYVVCKMTDAQKSKSFSVADIRRIVFSDQDPCGFCVCMRQKRDRVDRLEGRKLLLLQSGIEGGSECVVSGNQLVY